MINSVKNKVEITGVSYGIRDIIENDGGFRIPKENIEKPKKVRYNANIQNQITGSLILKS